MNGEDLLHDDVEESKELEAYADALIRVMQTRQGRLVMYQQLLLSRVFSDTFDKDSHLHAHYAGMKRVGIETMNTLKSVCYDAYSLMLQENENG
jgi:hypothetical protein